LHFGVAIYYKIKAKFCTKLIGNEMLEQLSQLQFPQLGSVNENKADYTKKTTQNCSED